MPVRNAPSPLPATLRFMGSRLAHRLRGSAPPPDSGAWRRAIEAAVAQLPGHVARCDFVSVPAAGEPWRATGIRPEAGTSLSLLAEGTAWLSRLFDVRFGAGLGLWYRCGESDIANVGHGGASFTAPGGELRFASKPPGEFADRQGRFETALPREGVSGSFEVAVIQWRGALADALRAVAAVDRRAFASLLRSLHNGTSAPPGWHHLWRLGESDIFSRGAGGELCCHTHADVAILQYPLRRSLTAETRIDWSWCVEQLPSRLPEHIQPTHDYLSLAVEFDNGLDLTWLWSAELPVDTIFQCPLPWWDQRETHWVVRSGAERLGSWCTESRALKEDYEKAIGGVVPRDIVAVWVIANSAFQRGEGRCRYRDIVLRDAEGELRVA